MKEGIYFSWRPFFHFSTLATTLTHFFYPLATILTLTNRTFNVDFVFAPFETLNISQFFFFGILLLNCVAWKKIINFFWVSWKTLHRLFIKKEFDPLGRKTILIPLFYFYFFWVSLLIWLVIRIKFPEYQGISLVMSLTLKNYHWQLATVHPIPESHSCLPPLFVLK